MRSIQSKILDNEITRNPYIWGAILLCLGLLSFAVYVDLASSILNLSLSSLSAWPLILIFSLLPLVVIQTSKMVLNWKQAL